MQVGEIFASDPNSSGTSREVEDGNCCEIRLKLFIYNIYTYITVPHFQLTVPKKVNIAIWPEFCKQFLFLLSQ